MYGFNSVERALGKRESRLTSIVSCHNTSLKDTGRRKKRGQGHPIGFVNSELEGGASRGGGRNFLSKALTKGLRLGSGGGRRKYWRKKLLVKQEKYERRMKKSRDAPKEVMTCGLTLRTSKCLTRESSMSF